MGLKRVSKIYSPTQTNLPPKHFTVKDIGPFLKKKEDGFPTSGFIPVDKIGILDLSYPFRDGPVNGCI